jgi:sugar phosphate isomerase/epimerase
MHNRRTFLQTSAAAALSLTACRNSWGLTVDHPYMKTLGLQLWTVRDQMQEDAAKTMAAIAAAGYKQVESNIDNLERDAKLAAEHGMQVTSFFNDWRTLAEPNADNVHSVEATLDAAKKHNVEHIVFGYIGKHRRETLDQYKATVERTNKAAELYRAADVRLCYHNHAFEFEKLDGETCGFDILMNELDPKLVEFELDVFWTALGGWDPIETMKKLGNRISQLHLKDIKEGAETMYDEGQVPKETFQELGNGTLNMKQIIELGQELGVAQCHVEQDQSPDPLKSIVTSIEHLRSI